MPGGGGSPSGQTTSTQNTAPWSGQQPFLAGGSTVGNFGTDFNTQNPAIIPGTTINTGNLSAEQPFGLLPTAAALYGNYTPQYYPGATVAPFSPAESTALGGIENLAFSPSPVSGAANTFNTNLLNGNYLGANPGSSYLTPIASGQVFDPNSSFMQNLTQSVASSVAPNIEAGANAGGSVNNPNTAYALGQGMTSALAPMELGAEEQAAQGIGQNWQNTLQSQLQSLFYAPQTQNMPFQQLDQGLSAGQTEQQQQQNQIQAAINQWNYGQMLPYNMLGMYGNEIGGNYGGASTMTQPYYTSPGLSGVAGAGAGALSGAALGSEIYPGWGTAIGAIGGALYGGLSSDRRLKTDIEQIGTADNDLPIYLFRYKGDHIPRIGFMSDDVKKVHPEAVTRGPLGYDVVNYEKAAA